MNVYFFESSAVAWALSFCVSSTSRAIARSKFLSRFAFRMAHYKCSVNPQRMAVDLGSRISNRSWGSNAAAPMESPLKTG